MIIPTEYIEDLASHPLVCPIVTVMLGHLAPNLLRITITAALTSRHRKYALTEALTHTGILYMLNGCNDGPATWPRCTRNVKNPADEQKRQPHTTVGGL
jgi:hypothetical protein